jgi:hypothetical protein
MCTIRLKERKTLRTKEKSRHIKEKHNGPENGPMVEKVKNSR